MKTLRNHIASFFKKELADGETDEIIKRLIEHKVIECKDGKISYGKG